MQLRYCSAKTEDELKQILALQKKNLPNAISEEERIKEGFVTVSHDLDLLVRMNLVFPHTIVKDGNTLVGYALSMHPQFADDIEVLKPMFAETEAVLGPDENYIIMGQVCVAKAYRGKGVFRKLYKTMLSEIQPAFNCIITEVDSANTRSLYAHYAVGFKELKKYNSGGRDWHLIILKSNI